MTENQLIHRSPTTFTEPPFSEAEWPGGYTPLSAVRTSTIRLPAAIPPPVVPTPPTEWIARVATVIFETLHRQRPVVQLRQIASPRVIEQLAMRREVGPTNQRQLKAVKIDSIRVSQAYDKALEVAITYQQGSQFLPMAMRLEPVRGFWLVTACELPPW